MLYNVNYIIVGLLFSIPVLASSSSDSLEFQLESAKGKEKIDILNQIAIQYQFMDIEKSDSFAQLAYSLSESTNYPNGKALALINIGEFYLSMDSISESFQYFQRGLNLSKLSNYAFGIAFAEFHMGKIYMSFSDYSRALSYFYSSLQTYDSLNDLIGKSACLIQIGDIQVAIENYQDALNYYKNALQIIDKNRSPELYAQVKSKIGLTYFYKNDLEKGLNTIDEAIEEYKSLTISVEELLYYKAQIYIQQEDYKQAIAFLNESSSLAINNHNYLILAQNQFQLAQIFVAQKKYQKAEKYFLLSLEYSKKRNVKKLIAENYKGLSELYFAQKNNLKAYKYQSLYAQMKDSVLNEETSWSIHDLKLKYETEETEKENEILKKNNLIQSLELSKQRYLTLLLIALVVISLVIVFFIINLYRNNRKTNALLRQKNQEVSTQKTLLEDALSKLMRSEKKTRAMLQAIPDMMFLLNDAGIFLETHANNTNNFIAEKTHITNKNLAEIFPAAVAKQYLAALKKAQKSKELELIEFQLSINKEQKDFESRIVHMNEEVFLCITRDTTERKRLETNLIRAKEEAEDATKSKSMFLATMSHEIRTPMSGIIGMSEVMKDTPLNAKQKEYINIIYTSANSLLSIINDILDFSKVEAGQLLLDSRPFNPTDVVHETTNMLLLKAQDKGVGLFTSIAHNVPRQISGDPNRLLQILLNLTNNALKFTYEGNVTIDVSVAEETKKIIKLKFSIIDTGVGISEEEQNSLFKPFFQTESGRVSKSEGTGLGLSIVKNLVSLMKGKVGIISKLGEGSTFWFIAEFGNENKETSNQKNITHPPSKNRKSGKMKILIAEDDPINQKLISIVVQRAGYEYDIAANGVDAVKFFKENKYDVVLMDIDMPKMDGIEATINIREYEVSSKAAFKIGIIAVTAKAIEGDRKKCLSAGMNDYITKPFKPDDLLNSIQTFLPK